MKKKILIYDDELEQTERFKDKLEQGLKKARKNQDFVVETLCEDALQCLIEKLQNRQEELRDNGTCSKEATEFDKAAIFIIDYDLLKSQATKFLTGEIIAYIVRCFSECKLIVGLNQYGHNSFDLTLRGHPESFADLNLGVDQLSNPDLWRGDWGDLREDYRPWHWPNLCDSLRNFDRKVTEVRESLDSPIYEVLGFKPDFFQLLPREIVQFIGEDKEPDETTFQDFVMRSGNGLRPKDSNISDKDVLARVGAARISKWLERLVLPEQDLLVDAPHLVSRYPSLIVDDTQDIEVWNRTAQLIDYSELGLHNKLIETHRFEKDYWISRPAWFWDKLREDESIQEIIEPWATAKIDWVFCEDASCFHIQEECKEFFADTVSPFTRRFVKGFQAVDYRPRVRFAL